MKFQVITWFAVILSVCHGQQSDGVTGSNIIINNATEPIPVVTDVPNTNPNSTTTTTTLAPTTTNATTTTTAKTTTTTTPPTPPPTTTTQKPNSTTVTTTTTHKPPTTTNSTTIKPTPPPSPPTNEPTKAPVTTAAPIPASNRKFDGPSFVGGIVLASGLMAIGFVAFKFYKARTELNYHTL